MILLGRTRLLLAVYVGTIATAGAMAMFDILGMLPVLLLIAAVGGVMHLGIIVFFNKLPDHLDDLRSENRRRH